MKPTPEHIEGKDRVQGMLGAADRWVNVIPRAVVSGSQAQAENVLSDAIHDIRTLWAFAVDTAQRISDAQAALAAAEERGRLAERERCKQITKKVADDAAEDYPGETWIARLIIDAITKEPTP